ncbi:Sensory neuron membrane protein 1 [Cryptotermes secundus]|uniref:Sensory neuron membrane protein 1 n=2 Tax=Cryptotermes secundus TaxID=105785 RepID=A0A2J7RCL6_9NEOP|nr:sensory neuron membrane protein 1 isoform X1 [Cryptotermes secundus]XP_023702702.1 sensory neuron membrane protein 1 isoform X2 [Cryptotermes secundus]PNF38576.1 Sensory neuron membrane protein 1 [Cryptotermes secundus]PNF38577.1 Sensory neuron membrane protein 1 [Cryptotermes secundus]
MKKVSLRKQSPAWLVLSGMVIFVLGAVLGWYGFPALVRSQIASSLELKEGSERREIWEKAPYPMDFKIYLFNVTYLMEVQKGATPVVQEVGPYCYSEDKEKVNIVDHEDDDTVSFNLKDTWHFNQSESGNLTGDEIVTIPHVLLLGMVLTAQLEQPIGLKLINMAIPHIFDNPTSVFVTASAKDLLFDGVQFNCTASDFSTKAVCSELKKRAHNFHRVSEDIFKISIFGSKNGTVRERLRVKRGIENITELGRVVEFKDQRLQNAWDGDKCNELRGTDSTIFPPFLTKKDKIEGFLADLCRAAVAEYQYATTYSGIRSYKYSGHFGDISADPDLKCHCTTPSTCLKRGVHDISRCTGYPIAVSLPHFYLADDEYLDGVVGLNPTQEKHEVTLLFEPLTATPLEAYKRLQLNIALHRTDGIDLLKNVKSTLLPILWMQENMELHQEYVNKILDLFLIISIMGAMKWIMIASGGILTATGFFFIMHKKNDGTVITGSPPIALKSTGKPATEK